MALLRDLNAAGTTVVVITHDRELAAGLPRQISVRDGRVSQGAARGGDPMTAPALALGRLAAGDVLRVGAVGLRTRPLRAALSALGIAIGIAAMLAVVGISASGRADLQRTLDTLGTNLLTVAGGDNNNAAGSVQIPDGAVGMIERIAPVQNAAAISELPDDVHVYRNDHIPAQQTNGIRAYAADLDLLPTVGASIADGAWLNPAIANYPGVVLGANSAQRLGIGAAGPGVLVQIGDERFAVIGILSPVPLVPELDSAALVGPAAARKYLGGTGHPTTIFLRAIDEQVPAVRDVLAATANPSAPVPGGGVAAIGCSGREAGDRAGVQRTAARARRGRPAGRRGRRGQHDGDLGAGAPGRDRATPVPRRDPGPDPPAVPDRVVAAGRARRHRRGGAGRRGDHRLRGQSGLAGGHPRLGHRCRPAGHADRGGGGRHLSGHPRGPDVADRGARRGIAADPRAAF